MCNCEQGSFYYLAFFIFASMKRIIFLFIFLSHYLFSQEQIVKSILLDSVTVTGVKDGFDIDEFIHYVKTDTTFYMAFKNLRYYTHKYESELSIYNRKDKIIGSLNRSGNHFSNGKNAWVVDDTIYKSGKVFSNKAKRVIRRNNGLQSSSYNDLSKIKNKYKFYTPKAFDEVFFPYDTIKVSLKISDKKNKNESQNMRDAKTVGFTIGNDNTEQKKGGMSVKLAVFDISMRQYYDYSISTKDYNGRECYVFTVEVKKGLSDKDLKEALIRKIVSYFDKSNFNVLHREYIFSYRHLLIDLDMRVVVDVNYFNGKHVPTYILYDGYWNVPLFKPEKAKFTLNLRDYIVD